MLVGYEDSRNSRIGHADSGCCVSTYFLVIFVMPTTEYIALVSRSSYGDLFAIFIFALLRTDSYRTLRLVVAHDNMFSAEFSQLGVELRYIGCRFRDRHNRWIPTIESVGVLSVIFSGRCA